MINNSKKNIFCRRRTGEEEEKFSVRSWWLVGGADGAVTRSADADEDTLITLKVENVFSWVYWTEKQYWAGEKIETLGQRLMDK